MTALKIATWNVNSIKARLPNVLAWLKEAQPDVVLLQELKCMTEAFPLMEIEDMGYNAAVHGQKTYNGVAILSKHPIEDVVRELPGDKDDEQARYIEAVISVPSSHSAAKERPPTTHTILRAASIYVPNGGSPDSDKFAYKLKFLERLRAHAEELLSYEEALVLGADYNVAPEDIDVYDPKSLRGTTCFHPEEQKRFRALTYLGLTDAYRAMHPDKHAYSWWDYRGGGWQQNKGMRIDHLLLSATAADCVTACEIDEDTRARDKASDHAPVWVELGV